MSLNDSNDGIFSISFKRIESIRKSERGETTKDAIQNDNHHIIRTVEESRSSSGNKAGKINNGFHLNDSGEISKENAETKKEIFQCENADSCHSIPSIKLTQVLAAFLAAIVHVTIGVSFGFTAVTLPELTKEELSNDGFVLSEYQGGLFVSALNIGTLIGSVFCGPMIVKIGQRGTILTTLPIGIISWLILTQSKNFHLFVLCRVMQGVVFGCVMGAATSYIAEVSHSSIRGKLLSLTDFSRQFGFLLVYIVGSTTLTWRSVGLTCGLTTMALPCLIVFFPNSPRWLASKNSIVDAKRSLKFFRNKNYDVDKELSYITSQLNGCQNGSMFLNQLMQLKNFDLAERVIILAILQFCVHFTGNHALLTFSVSIFQYTATNINAYLSTILIGCTRVLGAVLNLLLADRLGRRSLFLIPTVIQGLCMFLMALYFYLKDLLVDTSYLSWMPTVILITFQLMFCISNPVTSALPSELLPNSFRSFGVGLLFFIFSLSAFLVAYTFPIIIHSLGIPLLFLIYGSANYVMVIVFYFYVPETKGMTLEEIDEYFKNR